MIQDIIALLIVFAALVYTLVGIYRIFFSKKAVITCGSCGSSDSTMCSSKLKEI